MRVAAAVVAGEEVVAEGVVVFLEFLKADMRVEAYTRVYAEQDPGVQGHMAIAIVTMLPVVVTRAGQVDTRAGEVDTRAGEDTAVEVDARVQ